MANVHIPEEHMLWIHRNNKPVIYVCQDIPDFGLKIPISSVNMDNQQAICDMVHFLYNMGHRNIAFIGGPLHDLSAGKKRYDDNFIKLGQLATVKQKGKWGVVGTDGKVLLEPQYLDIDPSSLLDFAKIARSQGG